MQWEKGVSGNLKGRPKGHGDVRALARQHTADAVSTLVTIMLDNNAAASARTSAASAILDRGWGKPEQSIMPAEKHESYIDFLRQIAEQDGEDVEALEAEGQEQLPVL
jgi:hypothetical protein